MDANIFDIIDIQEAKVVECSLQREVINTIIIKNAVF